MFCKILAVDDSKFILKAVEEALHGVYEVTLRNSAEDAIEYLKIETPDLIISDMVMPKIDGFGFIKLLKENPATKNIPFVFLSGTDRDRTQDNAIDIGAYDYIEKPFKAEYLRKRVGLYIDLIMSQRRVIEQKRLLEEKSEFIESLQNTIKKQRDTIEMFEL